MGINTGNGVVLLDPHHSQGGMKFVTQISPLLNCRLLEQVFSQTGKNVKLRPDYVVEVKSTFTVGKIIRLLIKFF